jgi:hypothetical protein
LPVWCKRVFRKGDYGKLRSFEESGINLLGPVEVTKMLEGAGFRTGAVRWLNHAPLLGGKARVGAKLGGLTAQDWMLDAVR